MDEEANQASSEFFAIVQWSDKFANVINLGNITFPKKNPEDYKEGEFITAWFGKGRSAKKYRARISQISGKFRTR